MDQESVKEKLKFIYYKYLWWAWQVFLVLLSLFFLLFGIQIFVLAYQLDNPFNFILCFFASNLIILISAVLLIGFVYRMIGVYRLTNPKSTDKSEK